MWTQVVEFCPKCGSIMVPRRKGGKTVLMCPRCGYRKESGITKTAIITKKVKHKETEKMYVISSEDRFRSLPRVKGVRCAKCGHDEAYYMILQTRSADEPPTRIYKCARCGYTWREYE